MIPQGMNPIAITWKITYIHNTYLGLEHASIIIDGVVIGTHMTYLG
jgi:hypothetical protein